jgi:hypothetical protein
VTAAPLRVWLVDEGSHGHRAQSEGAVAAIERLGHTVALERIAARERWPGALRPALRLAVDRGPRELSVRTARAAARFAAPATGRPDLVVSSGGKSVFANLALARAAGAPNLFVGDPRPYPVRWFGAVLGPERIGAAPNLFAVPAPPTPVTPATCAAAAGERWPDDPPRRVWALLIGGASRSHRFAEDDFARLAEGANALARRFGIRWLVSTSRRSGAAVDAVLAERLAPEAVADLTLFSRRPEPVVLAYLGAAERAFVTQDSLTMLAEAIASGRPAVAVAPADVRLPSTSVVRTTLARLERVAGFERRPIAGLGDYEPAAGAAGAADTVREALDRATAAALGALALEPPAP